MKYYTCYKITAKPKTHKEAFLFQMRFTDTPITKMTGAPIVNSAKDEKLISFYKAWNTEFSSRQKTSLSHYTTKCFIHQCSKQGIIILSNTEVKKIKEQYD